MEPVESSRVYEGQQQRIQSRPMGGYNLPESDHVIAKARGFGCCDVIIAFLFCAAYTRSSHRYT